MTVMLRVEGQYAFKDSLSFFIQDEVLGLGLVIVEALSYKTIKIFDFDKNNFKKTLNIAQYF